MSQQPPHSRRQLDHQRSPESVANCSDGDLPGPDLSEMGSMPLGRRRMLLGSLMLGAGILGGCGRSPQQVELRLGAMTGTIPARLPGAFLKHVRSLPPAELALELTPDLVKFAVEVESLSSSQAIAENLLKWQDLAKASAKALTETSEKEETPLAITLPRLPSWVPFVGHQEVVPSDLVLLGDRWLSLARREKWIQPLGMKISPEARRAIADDRWAPVMAGTADREQGQAVWGMPYRWGTTVLVYRKDKVDEMGGPITDWSDLWRSQLRGKVILLDRAREVIGATVKSLGGSYNVANLDEVDGLGDRLAELHQQVLFYGSTDYLQPLLMGDAWVAMGWSRDVLPILPRRSQLAAVVPQSGSALWADLWVRPRETGATEKEQSQTQTSPTLPKTSDKETFDKTLAELQQAWVEFCWTPDIARRVTLQTTGASPQFLRGDWGDLAKDNRGSSSDHIRFPQGPTLANCEFLLPLSSQTRKQYRNLWTGLGTLE